MAGTYYAMSIHIKQKLVIPNIVTALKLLGYLVREMGWKQARMVVRKVEPERQVILECLARHLAFSDIFAD
jgi:hypothetical protein